MDEVIKDNCSKFLSVENLEIAHKVARSDAIELFKKESSSSHINLVLHANETVHRDLNA